MSDLPEIRNQLNHDELFDLFKRQLAKDLEQSNFPSDFVTSLQPDYEQIKDTIAGLLKENEKKADSNLMQLLYRVDISEFQLKKYLQNTTNKNYYQIIAELVIKRVLQKVVIKYYYRTE